MAARVAHPWVMCLAGELIISGWSTDGSGPQPPSRQAGTRPQSPWGWAVAAFLCVRIGV